MPARLPDPPVSGNEALDRWATDLVRTLEIQLDIVQQPAGSAYTVTGLNELRTLDAAADTDANIRSVLGTLIQDFQSLQRLR